MKRLTITLVILLMAGFTYAQTSQGSLLLGGGGSLWFQTLTEEDSGGDFKYNVTTISFNPTFGYFVADGIVVGAMLGFDINNEVEQDNADFFNKSTDWHIGPFGRYYHHSDFFAHAAVKFGASKAESGFGPGSEFSAEFGLFGFEAGIGRAIFFNEFVSVEPMILYQNTKYTNKDDAAFLLSETNAGPAFRINFSIFIE